MLIWYLTRAHWSCVTSVFTINYGKQEERSLSAYCVSYFLNKAKNICEYVSLEQHMLYQKNTIDFFQCFVISVMYK